MSLLLGAAMKFSLVLLLALAAMPLLRRRSAALRHWVLAAAVTCGLALPVLEPLAPTWHVPLPAAWSSLPIGSPLKLTSEAGVVARGPASATGNAPTAALAEPSAAGVSTRFFATVWLAGVSAALAVLFIGMIRMWRLASRSQVVRRGKWRVLADAVSREYDLRKPVLLLQSKHPTMLVTWGIGQPKVMLPAAAHQWTEERIRVVLCHELAHVKRRDWVVLMTAAVLRSVYWFSPMLWIACTRLRHESERACDDAVLKAGVTPSAYAEHLLAVARDTVLLRHDWSPAAAIASPSMLEGRIRAMLNTQLNREPLTRFARVSAAIGLTTVTLVIAGAGISTLAAPADAGFTAETIADPHVTRSSTLPAPGLAVDSASRSAPATPADVVVNRSRLSSQAAQSGPGSIEGVLYDQLGGLLPGVRVSLTYTGSGAAYQTVTDRNGAFVFRLLPPGSYELVTELPGFATVKNVVGVRAGLNAQRNIVLPIGSVTETISVTGDRRASGASIVSPNQSARRRAAPQLPQTQGAIPFSGGIGGQIRTPNKLVHVSPIYPAAQQAAGVAGVVVLVGRIGIDGYIADLQPRDPESRVDPGLTAAAMEASRQWEFTPTLLNGVPVEVNITITVQFGLP